MIAAICISSVIANGSQQLSVCEGEAAALRCPAYQNIHINSVFYGRQDRETCVSTCNTRFGFTCPHQFFASTSCTSHTVDGVVRGLCQGRNSCDFHATNEVLGGDPCFGIYKYFAVDYTCA